jgi:hypothetical protein
MIDDISAAAYIPTGNPPSELTLYANGSHIQISALQLTKGFEELFEGPNNSSSLTVIGDAAFQSGRMNITPTGGKCDVSVPVGTGDIEFATNIRIDDEADAVYGVALRTSDGKDVCRLAASTQASSISFTAGTETADINLPAAFTGSEFRQFRLLLERGKVIAYLDGIELGSHFVTQPPAQASIFSDLAISIEMLRLIEI